MTEVCIKVNKRRRLWRKRLQGVDGKPIYPETFNTIEYIPGIKLVYRPFEENGKKRATVVGYVDGKPTKDIFGDVYIPVKRSGDTCGEIYRFLERKKIIDPVEGPGDIAVHILLP